MTKEFELVIQQICDEKGISREIVMETIDAAIASAYRRDYGTPEQKIKAEFDTETANSKIYRVYEVVEEEDLENPEAQIVLKDAKKKKKTIKVGEEIIEEIASPPQDFGRIAAQTAKQVIIQRIREAERDVLFDEFKDKEHTVINGTVQQIEPRSAVIDLGKISGVLPMSEQIPGEKYYIGQRLKVYVKNVEETNRGPVIILTRTDTEFIRSLFENEVPEISSGTVEIKNIVREPGRRTKMSVTANQEGVDPVGSCIGQRGTRVQAVLMEIGEEKIDIVLWDEEPIRYISNALSPAKVKLVKLIKAKKSEDNKQFGKAKVSVDIDQLSLAIGRDGQNVRLASKLTNWEIDMVKDEAVLAASSPPKDAKLVDTSPDDQVKKKIDKKSKDVSKSGEDKKVTEEIEDTKADTKDN